MAVNDILEEIENLVVESRHVAFTNKTMIDENDLVRLVEDLRNQLPMEISKAENIMQQKQDIIDAANEEAARVVEQAKAYANRLVEESQIVIEAQDRAREILQQAKAQEEEIRERSLQSSQQLRSDAQQYANQVFDHLIANVGGALNVVQQAKEELNRHE